MASLRNKLKAMAALSADWNAPERTPAPPVVQGLSDEAFPYPLTESLGNFSLADFKTISPRLFFGLNDLPARSFDPSRVVFLDTETTGLFGAAVQAFLVGVGFFSGDRFFVRQFLMRDLSAEEALLCALRDFLTAFDVIVTFNGKSFDVPLLETRMTFRRVEGRMPAAHIDLIHPSRRIYKLRIESCRLSNIEDKVFGAGREDDIDGAEIPGRYFRFIRSGDESLLTDILAHNRRDIVTMPVLAAAMCRALASPEENSAPADRFSIGRYYLRQKDAEAAQEYFSSVTEGLWSLPSMWQKSLLLKKNDPAAAAACWEEILSQTPDYCPAMIELCKYHEHTTRDVERALSYCMLAQQTGMGREKFAADLEKRQARLEKKRAQMQKKTR